MFDLEPEEAGGEPEVAAGSAGIEVVVEVVRVLWEPPLECVITDVRITTRALLFDGATLVLWGVLPVTAGVSEVVVERGLEVEGKLTTESSVDEVLVVLDSVGVELGVGVGVSSVLDVDVGVIIISGVEVVTGAGLSIDAVGCAEDPPELSMEEKFTMENLSFVVSQHARLGSVTSGRLASQQ